MHLGRIRCVGFKGSKVHISTNVTKKKRILCRLKCVKNIKMEKWLPFQKMCNRQTEKTSFFCITVPLVGHLAALISTKLHKDLCQQPGTPRSSWAGGMWEGVIWRGSWGFACESQSAWATLWSLEVPLDLEGLKWHVMNDFAEPQIFMHELQLYESLSPLKAASRSDGKAAKEAVAQSP